MVFNLMVENDKWILYTMFKTERIIDTNFHQNDVCINMISIILTSGDFVDGHWQGDSEILPE